jgi:hypothetical protein
MLCIQYSGLNGTDTPGVSLCCGSRYVAYGLDRFI